MKDQRNVYEYAKMKSPVGELFLIANQTHLVGVVFEKEHQRMLRKLNAVETQGNAVIRAASKQLNEYFAKKRKTFDLPIELIGTDFQKLVWAALSKIPYGKTLSYQEQAISIDNPKALRAVGRANGLNPISIIVPCHRVIGKSGKLTGYAGGLDIKKQLLALECQAEN